MSEPDQRFKPTGRIVVRRIGSDNLLVPVTGGVAGENAVFPVNESGLLVWEQLAAGRTVGETVMALTATYEVSAEQAASDCTELACRFVAEGLLVEVRG